VTSQLLETLAFDLEKRKRRCKNDNMYYCLKTYHQNDCIFKIVLLRVNLEDKRKNLRNLLI